MQPFVKLPVMVQAVQWFPGAGLEGVAEFGSHGLVEGQGQLLRVNPGDWIVGSAIGLYLCAPDVFERDYMPASTDDTFDFGQALRLMREGRVVTRTGNPGYVAYKVPCESRMELILEDVATKDFLSCWAPPPLDMWATDWVEVPGYDTAEHQSSQATG
jgi:hypothetical protein